MEFIVGLFIGIMGTYFIMGSRKTNIHATGVLPKYITYAKRMARLYNRIPEKVVAFNHLVSVYGQNLQPEARVYFHEAVDEYNRFWKDMEDGWDDMYIIANEMIEMFNEMEK